MTLTVYVSAGCWVCEGVADVLTAIAVDLPELALQIVDVDRAGPGEVPDAVFSVPTYTLSGVVVSLGNPPAGFVERLRALMNSGSSRLVVHGDGRRESRLSHS